MSNHITKINSQQRMDMIDRGLNPLNPEHVDKYLRGSLDSGMNENIDRIKAYLGEDINKSLGHSRESVIGSANAGQEYVPSNVVTNNRNIDPALARAKIYGQMQNEYGNTTGNVSPALLDFGNAQPRQQPQNNLNEVVSAGKKLATNYYNSFILSLKERSTKSHMEVYKALKAMLEYEKKLSGTNYLGHYQKSVGEISEAMYRKVTNKLND